MKMSCLPLSRPLNVKYSPQITVNMTTIPESTYPTKLDIAITIGIPAPATGSAS